MRGSRHGSAPYCPGQRIRLLRQKPVSKLAAEMEKAADAGDWRSIITRMDELERQFHLLSEAIENERARLIK